MINGYKGKLVEELHLAEKHHFTEKRTKLTAGKVTKHCMRGT